MKALGEICMSQYTYIIILIAHNLQLLSKTLENMTRLKTKQNKQVSKLCNFKTIYSSSRAIYIRFSAFTANK